MFRGFALLEVAIVAAMISILAAFLIASMSRERVLAGAAQCQANLASVVASNSMYTTDQRFFPPSYLFGNQRDGISWSIHDQLTINPNPVNGYIHWSGLFNGGGYSTTDDIYKCPVVPRGGAPAANPGPIAADWETGQINTIGNTTPGSFPNDRQAKRMAYTANAMLIPSNNFSSAGISRNSRFVPAGCTIARASGDLGLVVPERVAIPASTALFTEFAFGLQPDRVPPGSPPFLDWYPLLDSGVYHSRVPITPVEGISLGSDVFREPEGVTGHARFVFTSRVISWRGIPSGAVLFQPLSGVGRHHEGETAQFAKVDGSVVQMTVQDSVRNRLWGERFWSITGRGGSVRR